MNQIRPKVGQVWRVKSFGFSFTITAVDDKEVGFEINDSGGMSYSEDISNWPCDDYELIKDVE